MCRSIKTLRRAEGRASDEEIAAAALQYIRKISGYRVPAKRNEKAFRRAVAGVSRASANLIESLKDSSSQKI